MPNLPSAAKRMRADAKTRLHNQTVTSELKTISKKLYALAAQDIKKATEYARSVIRKFDKAASNGIIPRRRADRKKARVAMLLERFGLKRKSQ